MAAAPVHALTSAAGAFIARVTLLGAVVGVASLFAAQSLCAQQTGSIAGAVTGSESGAPLRAVYIHLEGTSTGVLSDENGRYRLDGVPEGQRVVVFDFLGRQRERRTVRVRPGVVATVDVALNARAVEVTPLVISATREAQALSETPATIGVVDAGDIAEVRPTHPSEIMGKVPGVWVNVTGGEGHMTAIRQPLTTEPVYLYLENGVPTRSTGFFNHNALYEINVPQARRIEVIKGPTSALYGSDAIGGVINVETRPAVLAPGLEATLEGGAYGYARLLASYGHTAGDLGLRTDLNLTRTEGWRDATGYERQSATVRWDQTFGPGRTLRAIATASHIDQQTAGSARLPERLYRSDPTANLTPISFREVLAARLSVEYAQRGDNSLVTVTPFARLNRMDMLPNWSLSYDPALWETGNRSLGVLTRYRHSFEPMGARLIVGLDVDWSPGEHFERSIEPVNEQGTFTGYTRAGVIYDYGVTFFGVSPYLQAEASPTERLRLTLGLRFDRLGYTYENYLAALQTGPHRRPADATVEYSELSPKLGATFDLGGGASTYASFSQGFRVPSQGQLFRQGPALNTLVLEPVQATNWEAGLRGTVGGVFSYQFAAYHMRKEDDILTYQRPDDNRETRNAGATLHRGLELGLGVHLPRQVVLETALSYARHTYEEWRPDASTDYSGNDMESAPRVMANTTVSWQPDFSFSPDVALEWVHLSDYYLNAQNTEKYDGHDLLNLRASVTPIAGITVFGRLNNVTDERYAESAAWSAFRGREFAPGMPRTLYVGAELSAERL